MCLSLHPQHLAHSRHRMSEISHYGVLRIGFSFFFFLNKKPISQKGYPWPHIRITRRMFKIFMLKLGRQNWFHSV